MSEESEKLDFSISYAEDLGKAETLQTISEKNFKNLESPNIGFKNGTYWFKVILEEKPTTENIIFDVPESTIRNITLYQNDTKINFETLNNSQLYINYDLESKSNIFYLKANFNYEVFFPLSIKTYNKIQSEEKRHFFINGIFYGFALMVLIVNIFFFFSLNDKTFLFYGFFLILIITIFLDYDGFSNSIFPNSYLDYHRILLHFFVCLSGTLFANQFLNIKYYLPKSNSIGIVLISITLCFYLLFIPAGRFVFIAIGDTFSMLVLFHYWCIGIIISKEYKFARFFVLGYSLILFSSFIFVFHRNWGLDIFSISLNTVKLGALFEMLILTYAITYRIKVLQSENDRFKKEINEYLNDIEILKNTSETDSPEIGKSLLLDYNLSEREVDVLLLIKKGFTNKRIGEELFIGINTVKYHIRNIYEKLDISSKNEAIDMFSEIKKSQ